MIGTSFIFISNFFHMTATTYVLTLSYSFNPDMERNFKPNVENGWKTIATSYKTSNM